MIHRRATGAALALVVVACGGPEPVTHARQAYRAAVVTAEGDEIPFFLELPSNCNTNRAVVINGVERLSIPCQRIGSRILLDFVVYGTRISAEADEAGNLSGHWGHTGGGIELDRLRFAARPLDRLDPALRFSASTRDRAATSAAAVAGTWRVEFGAHGLGKAVFTLPAAGVILGTAEVPSEYGDLRFLAGNVHGSSLSLSTFDGAGGYLIRAQVDASGALRGEFIGTSSARDAFTAMRSEDFDVTNPLELVSVTSVDRRLELPALGTQRYAGKPVIVELFGTWCSNCNDLAPLLVDLYREHRKDGLEILSIAYEISDDEMYRRERIVAYRAQHGVEWEIVIPVVTPEELLSVGPAKLSSIGGVPVTLFLDRDRTIRGVYTGFMGPATGATHQRAVATFRRLTREILASSAPPTQALQGRRLRSETAGGPRAARTVAGSIMNDATAIATDTVMNSIANSR